MLDIVIIGYTISKVNSIIGESNNKSFSANCFIDLLKIIICINNRKAKSDNTTIG